MRIAVVGTGRIGELHAELLREIDPSLELVVADVDAARARVVADEVDGSAASPRDAIGQADAVVIATPPASHRELVLAAVERRIPTFCEKPLAADLAETIDVVRRVEEAGATLQVGFQRRFDPGFAAARELVATGQLGRVQLLRLTAHDPIQPAGPASPGLPPIHDEEAAPIFRDSSIHDFDMARWLAGQEVVEVVAEGTRRDDGRPQDPRLIETAAVVLRLDAGALALVDATWLDPRGYDIRAELVGERDAVAVGLGPRTPVRLIESTVEASASAAPIPWGTWLERFRDAYRLELEAFLTVAAGEAASPCTARDGMEAMRIAVAATWSVAQRRAVPLGEVPTLEH